RRVAHRAEALTRQTLCTTARNEVVEPDHPLHCGVFHGLCTQVGTGERRVRSLAERPEDGIGLAGLRGRRADVGTSQLSSPLYARVDGAGQLYDTTGLGSLDRVLLREELQVPIELSPDDSLQQQDNVRLHDPLTEVLDSAPADFRHEVGSS